MHIVPLGDNLHEMSKPVFLEILGKNIIDLSSAQFADRVEKVNCCKPGGLAELRYALHLQTV